MINQVFGVIGGAGVAATNKFMELLEYKMTLSGAYRDMHHPEMIIFQATQAPSRSMYLEGSGESFIPDYINIAKKLAIAGATKICMTCNTAHYALKEIENETDISFIDMINETILEVKKYKKMNIGLIASNGCIKGNVYENKFNTLFPEVNIIYPDNNMQKKVTQGIVNIKNLHRFVGVTSNDRPKNIFCEVCNHLVQNGAEIIILGCTDIRVDFEPSDFTLVPLIDSLEVLVDSIYNSHLGEDKNEEQ
jgi:aspartate racemase